METGSTSSLPIGVEFCSCPSIIGWEGVVSEIFIGISLEFLLLAIVESISLSITIASGRLVESLISLSKILSISSSASKTDS